MNTANRDLLILSPKEHFTTDRLQKEVDWLHDALAQVENMQQFCIANEVIDINRFKIISDPIKIQIALERRINKPFVFINNKN